MFIKASTNRYNKPLKYTKNGCFFNFLFQELFDFLNDPWV
ncbi:hypothetical protein MGSAQ_001018 [marine sediment metagenome]|uniref:Uncharacterized protein n=1 Tax=marine sediment metagenome TaxID=412755 RepID=A0A1B6NVW6_9ZZZZ